MLLGKTLRSSTLKLASIYVGLFGAAILGLFGFVYGSTVSYLDREADRSIAAERRLLTSRLEKAGRAGLVELIDRRVADRHFTSWRFLLVDPAGRYIAGDLDTWPPALVGRNETTSVALPGAVPLRVSFQTLPNGDRLLVGRRETELDGFIATITAALAVSIGLLILLAVAAGISTARRSVTRIETINATSRDIMRSGPGRRIPLRGTEDEWDELAANLNAMLDRIEELAESNRQVSENVAHDLRTPLTRIRGRLERAANERIDAGAYRSLIDDTIAGLDEVLGTFASILRISQIEMRDRTAGFRPLDLAVLARDVVELFEPTAEQVGVRLHVDGDREVSVVGDRDLLFEALGNLVDNAIKHGGSGGAIIVAVTAAAVPAVSVADRGPGIPAEARAQVFKRFVRLEHSRHSPGNGLGLSLVAAVANLHGACIDVADNCPGLKIALRFPPQAALPPTRSPLARSEAIPLPRGDLQFRANDDRQAAMRFRFPSTGA